MADVSKAAVPALWAADPGFVALAKYLYGEDVTVEDIQKDLFGKGSPDQADVHAPAAKKKQRPPLPKNTDEDVEETTKRLEAVGKAFIDLVEKAYDEGLIDSEGNLNMVEIEKSRNYVRDHAGRFASSGKHTARNVGELALAGGLAAGGAAMATKSPHAMKYATESVKFVAHHLKSKDPVERHVARALLPHALKASGKGVGMAGAGAVSSAGAVYEGTRAYQHIRNDAGHVATGRKEVKAARADVSKDWADYDAKRKTSRREAGAAAGLGVAAGAAEGAGRVVGRRLKGKIQDATDRSNMWRELGQGSRQYANETGSHHMHSQAASFLEDARGEDKKIKALGRKAKDVSRISRHGAVGLAAGAGLTGLAAWDAHDQAKLAKPKREVKAARDVTWEGEFSKINEEKRQVFGWASVTEFDGKPVVDLQGDYIAPDEIEKAAYDYVVRGRVGGDMHSRVDENGNLISKADKPYHVSDLIESVVFTPEKCEAMGVSKSLAGRWWTGFQINDPDVWEKVKTGERAGFSIHGLGIRKSVEPEELGIEDELIGKAYEESESYEELIKNLETLHEVTGSSRFLEEADEVESQFDKHLAHGIHTPQINAQQSRNAGVYGSTGSAVGGLAGGLIGAKMGHMGEGVGIGAGVGGVTGTVTGVHAGKAVSKPQRPPVVHQAMMSPVHMRAPIEKAVATTNRMGGAPSSRQSMYTQFALQQATEQLAPQVAQHLQAMQEQQWQQQMMEQQMLQQQAQQQPQDFAVRMGPYANQPSQRQQQNPLAPPQQASGPSQPPTPSTPSAPTAQNYLGS